MEGYGVYKNTDQILNSLKPTLHIIYGAKGSGKHHFVKYEQDIKSDVLLIDEREILKDNHGISQPIIKYLWKIADERRMNVAYIKAESSDSIIQQDPFDIIKEKSSTFIIHLHVIRDSDKNIISRNNLQNKENTSQIHKQIHKVYITQLNTLITKLQSANYLVRLSVHVISDNNTTIVYEASSISMTNKNHLVFSKTITYSTPGSVTSGKENTVNLMQHYAMSGDVTKEIQNTSQFLKNIYTSLARSGNTVVEKIPNRNGLFLRLSLLDYVYTNNKFELINTTPYTIGELNRKSYSIPLTVRPTLSRYILVGRNNRYDKLQCDTSKMAVSEKVKDAMNKYMEYDNFMSEIKAIPRKGSAINQIIAKENELLSLYKNQMYLLIFSAKPFLMETHLKNLRIFYLFEFLEYDVMGKEKIDIIEKDGIIGNIESEDISNEYGYTIKERDYDDINKSNSDKYGKDLKGESDGNKIDLSEFDNNEFYPLYHVEINNDLSCTQGEEVTAAEFYSYIYAMKDISRTAFLIHVLFSLRDNSSDNNSDNSSDRHQFWNELINNKKPLIWKEIQ